MHNKQKSVLLVAMPFAGLTIPSIQLPVLEGYCKKQGIDVETRHLYLKAAEVYGLQTYHSLIHFPNDSYTAQLVFSKYVFPEHWKNNQDKFQDYFQKQSTKNSQTEPVSFEDHVHRTDLLYHWILEHVNWRSFDIIGFTLNYGQLLPSLAIAKKIKELDPLKKIVLGGSRTADALGAHLLEAFPYIDCVVSGEGEDALFRLAADYENHHLIPGVAYRNKEKVLWNKSQVTCDLESLPIPAYDSFYQELASTSDDIQQYYQYYGRLPVEISRGCWWNHCTFCNLNIQHHCYREKSIGRILQEIQWLSERYRMMDFQLIGNTLPKTQYQALFEQLKTLRRDFSFFVEARAGQLTSQDYTAMKEAGFTSIQTGIESFSRSYLRKMNKGVRVIDNIAALKFCKENGIKNSYNLIVGYPNEEPIDFEETKQVMTQLKGYLDTPQLCELRVMYGSQIYHHPEQFNIKMLTNAAVDVLMYPEEVLKKGIAFVYGFTPAAPLVTNNWDVFIEEWRQQRQANELESVKSKTTIDTLVFYFVDGGSFLKIYDKRDREDIRIFVLNELERLVFLSCLDVVSLHQLRERFSHVPEFELVAILQSFEKNGLVFVEDEQYLCLPLRCRVPVAPQRSVIEPVFSAV